MARKPMVTRTIITTDITVLCMNIETQEVELHNVTLTGNIPEKRLMDIIKAEIETDILKAVHIQSLSENENLYGLSETQFVELAEKLPPRGLKED